ncbi:MAG: hypothetical protein K0R41_1725 [Geminicoccaceae bacterium]|jgi:hypothetical protein|nr:hypothetical protein [Geminicoccaceae bacterium]
MSGPKLPTGVATDGITPEQAVNEVIARTKQTLSEQLEVVRIRLDVSSSEFYG